MKYNHFARKKRQLKLLVHDFELHVHRNDQESQNIARRILVRIKKLVQELILSVSQPELKKILGGVAIILGISFSGQVSAQSFAPPVPNPFGLDSANQMACPAVADLDGDGDFDLLVGEYYGVMQYYENTGTNTAPQFAAPLPNPFGLDSAYIWAFPAFADLDDDGDQDLLVGEYYGVLKYYKNTGTANSPQFDAPVISPFGLDTTLWAFPAFADLDNDGDFDLLTGEYYGAMHYYENIGTASNPQFATAQVNPFGLDSVYIIALPIFTDLDDDGDFDLLVGEYDGNMQYFKNTGTASNPQFASPQMNPYGLSSGYEWAYPAFADMDNDGDYDLFIGEYYGVISYFENTTITEKRELIDDTGLRLYPNPIENTLNIQSDKNIQKVEIMDISGRLIFSESNNPVFIKLGSLSSGTYYARICYDDGELIVRKIQKL